VSCFSGKDGEHDMII